MNAPEFANALAELLMQAQAAKALEIVQNDLDESTTAKARGHWHGLAEARVVLRDCLLSLTEPPRPAEPAPDQHQADEGPY